MAKGKHSNLFKIWDKVNNHYVSGNKKTHWKSMKWVESKIFDLCSKKAKYGYCKPRNPEEFEVHEFELVLVENHSATELLLRAEGKAEEAKVIRDAITKIEDAIFRAVKTRSMSLYEIRTFMKNKFFNKEIQEELETLFVSLDKLKK